MRPRAFAVFVLAAVAAAWGDSAESGERANTPWPVVEFPPLPEGMKDVPTARIKLGHLLFYDAVLSVDRETSCSTCHSERWGLSDALRRGVGHGAGLLAGPGRQGPNTLRRNSSTLYNLAFRETLTWVGEAETLEEQVLIPLFDEDEMGADPETIVSNLLSIPEYVDLFSEAFPNNPEVSIDNVASALAAYQRTFLSMDALYDKHAAGRTRVMTEDMIEGMFLFAEMGCHDCHTPPLFESETFANRNVPTVEGLVDHGRAEITELSEDRGKFRTVTLRNAVFTAPYFHNGTVDSLQDAVRHELGQGKQPFSDEDVRLVALFIAQALRDETNEAIRPASLPSELPLSVDDPGSR